MKKKNITLAILVILIIVGFVEQKSVKGFFTHKRYYPLFVALGLAKPQYNVYKHFYKVFEQEDLDYKKGDAEMVRTSLQKLADKNLQTTDQAIIPTITHQIYFTPPKAAVALSDYYIENMKLTFAKLEALESHSSWQHNIWTNDPSLFPDDIKNASNIKIRSIDEFKDDKLYTYLIDSINKGSEAKAYLAEASDMLRLIALQKFGGIYRDLDYEIIQPQALYNMMKKFDFLGGKDFAEPKRFYGNSFIAAKPNHPIINEALRLLYRNNNLGPDAPEYIRYPVSGLARIYANGPPLITIAYFKKNNIEGNSDIILPSWMIYNVDFLRFKNKTCNIASITREEFLKNNDNLNALIDEYTGQIDQNAIVDKHAKPEEQNIYFNNKYNAGFPIIGTDMFCGSWTSDGYKFPRIFYWNIPFINELSK